MRPHNALAPGIDYALVLGLIWISGIPWSPFGSIDLLLLGMTAVSAFRLTLTTGFPITRAGAIALVVFGVLSAWHAYVFDFLPLSTVVGFLLRIYVGFAVVTSVPRFPAVFVNCMTFMAVISLGIHGLTVSGVMDKSVLRPLSAFATSDSSRRLYCGIHSFMLDRRDFLRNAGPFWEPGAFAGYLNLAIPFLAFSRSLFSPGQYRLRFAILSIALLTTLSTTGYLAFTLSLLPHFETDNRLAMSRRLLLVAFMSPLVLVTCVKAYQELPFLQRKIEGQMTVVARKRTNWERTRFGTLVFNWEYIKRRPIAGWGLHSKTRYALHPFLDASDAGFGNGMADFVAKFGFVGMAFWLVATWKALLRVSDQRVLSSLAFLASALASLQGEAFLGFPMFLGLMFLQRQETTTREVFAARAARQRLGHTAEASLGRVQF